MAAEPAVGLVERHLRRRRGDVGRRQPGDAGADDGDRRWVMSVPQALSSSKRAIGGWSALGEPPAGSTVIPARGGRRGVAVEQHRRSSVGRASGRPGRSRSACWQPQLVALPVGRGGHVLGDDARPGSATRERTTVAWRRPGTAFDSARRRAPAGPLGRGQLRLACRRRPGAATARRHRATRATAAAQQRPASAADRRTTGPLGDRLAAVPVTRRQRPDLLDAREDPVAQRGGRGRRLGSAIAAAVSRRLAPRPGTRRSSAQVPLEATRSRSSRASTA